MPRRNKRFRRSRPIPPEQVDHEPTYEELARELVKAGRCSVLILDNPPRHPIERTS